MGKDSDSSEVLEEYEEYEEGCAVSLTVAGWTCAGLLLALLLAVLFIPVAKLTGTDGLATQGTWSTKADKSLNGLDLLMASFTEKKTGLETQLNAAVNPPVEVDLSPFNGHDATKQTLNGLLGVAADEVLRDTSIEPAKFGDIISGLATALQQAKEDLTAAEARPGPESFEVKVALGQGDVRTEIAGKIAHIKDKDGVQTIAGENVKSVIDALVGLVKSDSGAVAANGGSSDNNAVFDFSEGLVNQNCSFLDITNTEGVLITPTPNQRVSADKMIGALNKCLKFAVEQMNDLNKVIGDTSKMPQETRKKYLEDAAELVTTALKKSPDNLQAVTAFLNRIQDGKLTDLTKPDDPRLSSKFASLCTSDNAEMLTKQIKHIKDTILTKANTFPSALFNTLVGDGEVFGKIEGETYDKMESQQDKEAWKVRVATQIVKALEANTVDDDEF